MYFMNWIVSRLNDAASTLYDMYQETYSWVWPLNLISNFFYFLAVYFSDLAWNFSDFFSWLLTKLAQVGQVLTWDNIYSYFKLYFDAAVNAWEWVRYAWDNVTSIITIWWSGALTEVKNLIATATQGLDDLKASWDNFWNVTWPEWTGKLDSLVATWDTFWSVTFPTLVSFGWLTTWWTARVKDVQGLIDSAFTIREPFWSGWQEWRDKVVEFFTDPEEWLYKAMDRIIERFW